MFAIKHAKVESVSILLSFTLFNRICSGWFCGEGDTQPSWQSHGEPACAAYDLDVTKTCPETVPAINQPVDVQWTPG